jgi:acyl-CoA reductase-like NAD-dependent aldehyde dehydrogenase
MSKFVVIAGAMSALLLSSTFGQADYIKKLNLSKVVGCSVAGTPSEFPDDIVIMNKGLGTIAAGTHIVWSVPSAAKSGNYTLASALAPGQGVAVAGVLPGGVEAGKACKAKAV